MFLKLYPTSWNWITRFLSGPIIPCDNLFFSSSNLFHFKNSRTFNNIESFPYSGKMNLTEIVYYTCDPNWKNELFSLLFLCLFLICFTGNKTPLTLPLLERYYRFSVNFFSRLIIQACWIGVGFLNPYPKIFVPIFFQNILTCKYGIVSFLFLVIIRTANGKVPSFFLSCFPKALSYRGHFNKVFSSKIH